MGGSIIGGGNDNHKFNKDDKPDVLTSSFSGFSDNPDHRPHKNTTVKGKEIKDNDDDNSSSNSSGDSPRNTGR